ncbi:MAG: Por secretion system protein [Prevotella sp.]|nr:Por secretion system protein [Prevotella sp.]
MKKVIIALILSIVNCQLSIGQIGTWHNYLAYQDIQQIQEAGNNLFVMASNGLYQYNKNDQSIVTYDKTNGLSDTYITHIRWCQQAKRLIAVYNTFNIDLVETNGNITNISDIYSKVITGDKTLNNIYIYNQYAYLACGFGIVKLNVKDAEISESYMFGFPVTAITVSGNTIYAQTSQGILEANLKDNLIDTSNWHPATSTPSFDQDNTDYDNNIQLVKTLNPGGPHHNKFGFMKFANNQLYTANGDYNSPAPIQILSNNEWDIYEYEGISETTGVAFTGAFCFDIDPSNKNHLFAGARNGLYEYLNGKLVNYYNYENSPIEPFDGVNREYQLVTGTKFDKEGTLWALNSSAPTTALFKYVNGTFSKLNHPELMKLNRGAFKNRSNGELSSMIIDSQGLMWFVNNNWVLPALYQYNTQTDAIKAYESFVNQDGTIISVSEGVRCVTEDLEKNIWIGTYKGPLMLERSQINQDGSIFTQVKVPRNDGTNYADYLLANIDINSIAIDGGGRKWFGTSNNGVYLISADNMTQLQHFTKDNTPLLSDVILSIAIDNTSGEVYFATDKGLCSYMSDATQTNTEMTKDNVWAYPNPVTPGYTGPITITGLTYNADVKILSSNGALIHEGRSNGGTYIWDGSDKKGRRVASGVYMVVTATNTGEKGTVCKIAIVN